MKSKEKVLEHLKNVPYSKMAISKILGFLIGKGIKEEDERIVVQQCDCCECCEWSDFWLWFNDEYDDECVLCTLLSDLSDKINEEKNAELKKRYQAQLRLLLEEFDVEEC